MTASLLEIQVLRTQREDITRETDCPVHEHCALDLDSHLLLKDSCLLGKLASISVQL